MTSPLTSLARWIAAAIVAIFCLSALAPAANAREDRIIGGTEVASINDVPWQVGLINRDQSRGSVFYGQFCGGTIINPQWVLTAAHCLKNYKGSFLGVFAGNADLGVAPGTDVHTAATWKVHPNYTPNRNADLDIEYNDLALVKLASPLDLSAPAMEAATLPTHIAHDVAPEVGDSIHVSGWGATITDELDIDYPGYPDVLREVDLEVLSNGEVPCGEYSSSVWNSLYEICVGVDGGGKDTCWGDSGGPYIDDIDGDGDGSTEPTLIGITSWGNGCAEAAYPGFATRVSSYVDWIVPRSPGFTTALSRDGLDTVVSWQPLADQLLSYPVSGYRVEYSTDAGDTWQLGTTVTAKKRTAVVRGVTSAEWRLAAINAVNVAGGPYLWSGDDDTDTARDAGVPDAPASFAYLYRASKNFVFSWDQPDSVNGSAVWDFRVYRQKGAGAPKVVESGRSQLTTIGVPSKSGAGTYWVVAVNNFGESVPSNTVDVR